MLAYIILLWSVASCLGHHDEGFKETEHHDNNQLKHVLDSVHKKCPDITKVYHLSFKGQSETVKKNKLYVIVFGKNPGKHVAGIPEFKYVGNMHGNEVVGREMLLRWVHELCRRYISKDPYAVKMIENTRMHIMPTMNPDGWAIAKAQKGEKREWLVGRSNGNNVDLNRNFPDLDKVAFKNYYANGPIDHLFKPAYWELEKLQTETKMVMKWILSNNFVLSANLHGGDVVANYPYDESNIKGKNVYTASPDDGTFRQLALAYATHNPYMYGRKTPCRPDSGEEVFPDGITNGADWYSVGGGMQDFNYLASNSFEITVEMGCVKFPKGKDLPKYWLLNGPALDNFALQVHTGIKGIVKGLKPLAGATIMVFNVTDGEQISFNRHNILSGEFGDYYRLLADGSYVVLVSANGYKPLMRCVHVKNEPARHYSAQHLDFVLQPASGSEERQMPLTDASCENFVGFNTVREVIGKSIRAESNDEVARDEPEEMEDGDEWSTEE